MIRFILKASSLDCTQVAMKQLLRCNNVCVLNIRTSMYISYVFFLRKPISLVYKMGNRKTCKNYFVHPLKKQFIQLLDEIFCDIQDNQG